MAEKRPLVPTSMTVDYLAVYGQGKYWSIDSRPEISIDFNGVPGDRHYGPTRNLRRYQAADHNGAAVLAGREVPNDRSISIVEVAGMRAIAHGMGLPVEIIELVSGVPIAHFMADQLGANILVEAGSADSGLHSTAVSGAVYVFGGDYATAAAVRLTEYNYPCNQPATQMHRALLELGLRAEAIGPVEELREAFMAEAAQERGWVGMPFCAGTIAVGQELSIYPTLQAV